MSASSPRGPPLLAQAPRHAAWPDSSPRAAHATCRYSAAWKRWRAFPVGRLVRHVPCRSCSRARSTRPSQTSTRLDPALTPPRPPPRRAQSRAKRPAQSRSGSQVGPCRPRSARSHSRSNLTAGRNAPAPASSGGRSGTGPGVARKAPPATILLRPTRLAEWGGGRPVPRSAAGTAAASTSWA